MVVDITASDGNTSTTEQLSLNVTDVNEEPEFTGPSLGGNVNYSNLMDGLVEVSIPENTPVGHILTQLVASDVDDGDIVTFVSDFSASGYGFFQVDSTTGEITATDVLDYEITNQYNLLVYADDTDYLHDELDIIINVTDVNEAPVIESETTDLTYDENQDHSSNPIYYVYASDQDTNDDITFSLGTDKDEDFLDIDPDTGEVTLRVDADYETKSSYTFDVIATDDGDGLLSATQEITVGINDLNDDPVITSDTGAPVDENNTEIYTATATDEDTDDTVTLSLSGTDADKMTLDPSTGVVTLDDALIMRHSLVILLI